MSTATTTTTAPPESEPTPKVVLPAWVTSLAKYYGPVGLLAGFAIMWGAKIDDERKAQAERSYNDQKAFTLEMVRVTVEQTKVSSATAEAIREYAGRLEQQTDALEAQGRLLEEVARDLREKP